MMTGSGLLEVSFGRCTSALISKLSTVLKVKVCAMLIAQSEWLLAVAYVRDENSGSQRNAGYTRYECWYNDALQCNYTMSLCYDLTTLLSRLLLVTR